ncbi:glycosyltransferase family 4 protein [Enterococcus sp.]|uniref:glycosyltransferase family 4 protein n=1 Tax=Enterococcus sp. TaxID=35783 RepID=UPI002FCA23CB
MKKDVILLCQFFYPEKVSSALLPFQTAVAIAETGLTVDVMCGYPKEYVEDGIHVNKTENVDGISIYRKKYIQLKRSGKLGRLINYFSFTVAVFLNIFQFKNYKSVIVYSNPPVIPIIAVIANKLFGIKIVFVAYDLYPEIAENMEVLKHNSLISRLMKRINRYLYKYASAVVSLSNEMKEFIINHREIPEEKIVVFPNWATESGIEENSEITTQFYKELRRNYKIIVSYFGNMGTAQDIETIERVIGDVRLKKDGIGFLFAGHGNKKREIEQFIREGNLDNCYVFDYLSGEQFEDALKITDISIVSLEKKLSGLAVPSKTYSYYQSGKPVISIMDKETDISKEIQENYCGLSVENGNSIEIVEWLLSLNPNLITEMKRNVVKLHTEKYAKEKTLLKYTDLIKKVISEENHV